MGKARQTLTKLQRGLKKIFKKGGGRGATLQPIITELRKLAPLFAPSVPPAPPQAQQQQQGPKPPHAKRGQPSQAVLAKKHGYAQNGSNFIRGLDGRGVYKSFSHLLPFRAADVVAQIAETHSFPGSQKQNFDPGAFVEGKRAGQKYPYPWEAHHIIPGSAFYLEVKPGTPVFTLEQYEILLQSTYDLNQGHNIIMLPDREDDSVYIHLLLAHPSDHPAFTKWVMAQMKGVADEIEKLVKEAKPHDDIVKNFADKLHDLEEDGWDLIVALSKAKVGAALAGLVVTDGELNKGLRLA